MTRIDHDDLADEIRRLKADIRRLKGAAPINNASITKGHLRVASPEGLIVEGSAKVTGVLDGSGTLHWTGQVQLEGPVQIIGTVTRSGNETATGTTTFQGDVNVTGGGKVTAGAVQLSPVNGGQVTVGDLRLASDGTAHVGTRFRIAGGGIHVPALDSVTLAAGEKPGNMHEVYWNSTDGRLYRVVRA